MSQDDYYEAKCGCTLTICAECGRCSECCECAHCSECGDRLGEDDWQCPECDCCESCCKCVTCEKCDERFHTNSEEFCHACDRCRECCNCSDEEEEEEPEPKAVAKPVAKKIPEKDSDGYYYLCEVCAKGQGYCKKGGDYQTVRCLNCGEPTDAGYNFSEKFDVAVSSEGRARRARLKEGKPAVELPDGVLFEQEVRPPVK